MSERTGEPLTHVHKVWERLRNEAGLPQLRLHDLRHQFASFLVNSGRTLYEVQKILGHSNSAVTERYAHLRPDLFARAAYAALAVDLSGRAGEVVEFVQPLPSVQMKHRAPARHHRGNAGAAL